MCPVADLPRLKAQIGRTGWRLAGLGDVVVAADLNAAVKP